MVNDAAVLGTIGAGVIGSVDAHGVVAVGGITLRVWIGGVDRWRRSDSDAGVRQRALGDTPVLSHALHGPGGDTVWATYAFVPAGASSPAVAVDITNESTEPVIVATVVGPGTTFEVRQDTLFVDDRPMVRWARRPRSWVAHEDLDALGMMVESAGTPDGPLRVAGRGYVAVTHPLPHTVSTQMVLSGPGTLDGDGSFPVPPSPDQVVAGWLSQMERGTRIEPAEPMDRSSWISDRCLVALAETADGAAECASVAVADALLGWNAEAIQRSSLLVRFLDRRGSIGGDVDATVDALRAWSLLGISGANPEVIDELMPHIASTAGWLIGGRRRPDLSPAQTNRARRALDSAALLLDQFDQPTAARQLRAGRPDEPCPAISDPGSSDGLASPPASELTRASRRIVDLIDAHVAVVNDEIELAAGFAVSWAGQSVECHDIPTPLGRIGWAMRWHGRRPAVLWQVEPVGAEPSLAAPRLTAPAVDPAWSSTELTGDALLGIPLGVAEAELLVEATVDSLGSHDTTGTNVGPVEGESFS